MKIPRQISQNRLTEAQVRLSAWKQNTTNAKIKIS